MRPSYKRLEHIIEVKNRELNRRRLTIEEKDKTISLLKEQIKLLESLMELQISSITILQWN